MRAAGSSMTLKTDFTEDQLISNDVRDLCYFINATNLSGPESQEGK